MVKAKPMHSVVTFNKQLKIMLLTNLPHLRLSQPQHGCKKKNKYTSLNFVGPQSKATQHIQILPLPNPTLTLSWYQWTVDGLGEG